MDRRDDFDPKNDRNRDYPFLEGNNFDAMYSGPQQNESGYEPRNYYEPEKKDGFFKRMFKSNKQEPQQYYPPQYNQGPSNGYNPYQNQNYNQNQQPKYPSVTDNKNHPANFIDFDEPPRKSSLGNVVIYTPKNYEELKILIDFIVKGEQIIIDFADYKEEQVQRTLDFVSGAIYAIRGNIQKIGETQFILTPAGVDIMIQKKDNPGKRG